MSTIDPSVVTQLVNTLPVGSQVRVVLSNIVAVGTALIAADQVLLSRLPVASASSAPWYRTIYGLLARFALNFGNNAAVPTTGDAPAGGLVPVAPVQAPTQTGVKYVATAPIQPAKPAP